MRQQMAGAAARRASASSSSSQGAAGMSGASPRDRRGALDFDMVGLDETLGISRDNELKRRGVQELLRSQSGLDLYDSE